MKYYELYVSSYWLSEAKFVNKEVEVVKDTPKQLELRNTSSYIQHFNKSRLLKVIETESQKYVIYPEGQEAEARKLMTEALGREIEYHDKKLKAFKQLLKEVSNNG